MNDVAGPGFTMSEVTEEPPDDAHPHSPGEPPAGAIAIRAGQLHELATAAEKALIESGKPVFQGGGKLVRPASWEVPASDERKTIAAGFKGLSDAALIDLLSQAARWSKFDGRAKKWRAADPPSNVARILLSRAGQWEVPTVLNVITTPTMRRDGSIVSAPGFDEKTGLYHMPDQALALPELPSRITRDDAMAAKDVLLGLLREFPFVPDANKPDAGNADHPSVARSVALSALITPVVRGALGMVPLHAVTAPTAGTGKSYLLDIASAIATGRICPVITLGNSDEETEKRLGGVLLAGFPVISIDNMSGPVKGDLLCQLVERPVIRLRPLGSSEIVELESRATAFANGNNLVVQGDMTRRVLMCRMDAKSEQPETREFKADPVATVLGHRGKYVHACLCIVRGYMDAGCPNQKPRLASYGAWSDLMRSALCWLDEPDPVESMEQARRDDPVRNTLKQLMSAWYDMYGSRDVKLSEIVDDLDDLAENGRSFYNQKETALRNALEPIAMTKGSLNTWRLGNYLRRSKDRLLGGFQIGDNGESGGVTKWRVVNTNSEQTSATTPSSGQLRAGNATRSDDQAPRAQPEKAVEVPPLSDSWYAGESSEPSSERAASNPAQRLKEYYSKQREGGA